MRCSNVNSARSATSRLLRRWMGLRNDGGGPHHGRPCRRRCNRRTVASNAGRRPVRAGSGTDQCTFRRPTPRTSSWARSQTVTTRSGSTARLSSERGRAPARSRPKAAAAARVYGWTRSAGCVPALVAWTPCTTFHSAAASCERAEFCVQTNRTFLAVIGSDPLSMRAPISVEGHLGDVGHPPTPSASPVRHVRARRGGG